MTPFQISAGISLRRYEVTPLRRNAVAQSRFTLQFWAMYALAIIRYRRPFEEIAPYVDEHRAYLRELKAEGVLIASGPFDPRFGGGLLLRVPDADGPAALDRIRNGDPFTRLALAQYELLPWNPVIGKDDLDRL